VKLKIVFDNDYTQ